MTSYANEKGQKSMQWITFISDSAKIGVLVHLLDILIKVGRYLPTISLSMTSLNTLLAVNDFLTNNIGFAILNSIFAIGGFVFLIQMYQMGKAHSHGYDRNYDRINIDLRK